MVNEITERIMPVLVKKGVIADDKNSTDYYRTKVELAVGTFIALLFVIFLSFLLQSFVEGLLFIVLFVPIHHVTGGYRFHDPEFRCVGISLCYITVHYFMMYSPKVSPAITAVVFGVDILLVLLICPTKYARQFYHCGKKICKKVVPAATFLIIAAASMIMQKFGLRLSPLIFYTLQTNVIYMILADVCIIIQEKSESRRRKVK